MSIHFTAVYGNYGFVARWPINTNSFEKKALLNIESTFRNTDTYFWSEEIEDSDNKTYFLSGGGFIYVAISEEHDEADRKIREFLETVQIDHKYHLSTRKISKMTWDRNFAEYNPIFVSMRFMAENYNRNIQQLQNYKRIAIEKEIEKAKKLLQTNTEKLVQRDDNQEDMVVRTSNIRDVTIHFNQQSVEVKRNKPWALISHVFICCLGAILILSLIIYFNFMYK